MTPPPIPAAPATPSATAIQCPACGASITLRALGQCAMVSCPSCQTQIDVSRPDIQIIRRFREQERRLALPLGTRGLLRGQTLEVIGALQRSEGAFAWEEYLLYSPTAGFRWLVYDHGHWNFGRTVRDAGHLNEYDPIYQGRVYRRYQQGRPAIDWVVGEFYWRVEIGGGVETIDYISPPFVLSCEKSPGEKIWTQLEYLDPREVDAAFHITSAPRRSMAANQPNPSGAALRTLLKPALIAMSAAFVIQAATVIAARNTNLATVSFTAAHTPGAEEQVFGPYTFTARRSLNELEASAPLQNSWVELNCSLVNELTGETFDFQDAFEFYSGSDSDGLWTEGSQTGTALLISVPAGRYNLLVDGYDGNQNGAQAQSVTLTVRHDVAPWRNLWIVLGLIFAYPAWLFYRQSAYEKRRWSDSMFASKDD